MNISSVAVSGEAPAPADAVRPMLDIQDLSKGFTLHAADRRVRGCERISLSIAPGEFVGITGRSGSGKSTILKCIYRTNLPETGSIWYDSAAFGMVDLARLDERRVIYLRNYEIGYISQFLDCVPRTTAREIVEASAAEAFDDPRVIESETVRMLEHFDFPRELWDLYPNTFSGGEKLRLNIARAMVRRPRLLLLDEPTASLDNASKVKVRDLIEQLKEGGTTMLGIFHDLEFMEGVCDREYNMQAGEMR
ncbi:phosphonate C-P lyase system protein PhnL [Collinsella ihumii]|uniref:phosphonate C-P lyase system protein PhnL n=1 Tax=Collinsella ihumii TaxID=1720204 RepID=UPI000B213B1E|nr:ATP-binding cassette domain-containing protein [Collinsella ihumii]MDN0054982.1 ATP-binding cassette domain-containing protein [Collinsella ihumii]